MAKKMQLTVYPREKLKISMPDESTYMINCSNTYEVVAYFIKSIQSQLDSSPNAKTQLKIVWRWKKFFTQLIHTSIIPVVTANARKKDGFIPSCNEQVVNWLKCEEDYFNKIEFANKEALKYQGEKSTTPKKNVTSTFSFDYSNLPDYFMTDKIESFKKIENEMIQNNYFTEKGEWSYEKTKDILVALIYILKQLKYLKQRLPTKSERGTDLTYRKFFARRYKVDLAKEFQPTKFFGKKYLKDRIGKLKKYSPYFDFIPEIKTL